MSRSIAQRTTSVVALAPVVLLLGLIASMDDWGIPDRTEIAAFVFSLHAAVFGLLIIGARWSAFCWRFLTDPVWGKTALHFYLLLRLAGPVQRWVMTRWFDAVRQKTSHQCYLPMSLSRNGEAVACTTDLLDHNVAPERLWVRGDAGMGKTAMVHYLQWAFFGAPALPTLREAYARFRSVPIIVPLRDYRSVDIEPGQPGDWVAKVARLAVSALGVPFEDQRLFRDMIQSGGFLLILDGANEVEPEQAAAIEQFARSAPHVRLLVTSQEHGPKYFTEWHLPHNIHDKIEPLLCLFLGQQEGKALFKAELWQFLLNEVRSVYDVRLLAELVERLKAEPDKVIAHARFAIYDLILETIGLPDGSPFPVDRLCEAAWAMWKDGDRKLEPGKHLDKDLLDLLVKEDQRVLRIIGGQLFEFRHDQMRAYLAARWAALHDVNAVKLLEIAGESESNNIWRRSREEQDEVWNFFAEMYVARQPEKAKTLWEWSTDDPDRAILQHALQDELKRSGYHLEMSVSKQTGSPPQT